MALLLQKQVYGIRVGQGVVSRTSLKQCVVGYYMRYLRLNETIYLSSVFVIVSEPNVMLLSIVPRLPTPEPGNETNVMCTNCCGGFIEVLWLNLKLVPDCGLHCDKLPWSLACLCCGSFKFKMAMNGCHSNIPLQSLEWLPFA